MERDNEFRSPKERIMLGEFCYDNEKNPALNVKKAKSQDSEQIPLLFIIEQLTEKYNNMIITSSK